MDHTDSTESFEDAALRWWNWTEKKCVSIERRVAETLGTLEYIKKSLESLPEAVKLMDPIDVQDVDAILNAIECCMAPAWSSTTEINGYISEVKGKPATNADKNETVLTVQDVVDVAEADLERIDSLRTLIEELIKDSASMDGYKATRVVEALEKTAYNSWCSLIGLKYAKRVAESIIETYVEE